MLLHLSITIAIIACYALLLFGIANILFIYTNNRSRVLRETHLTTDRLAPDRLAPDRLAGQSR
jgi:hypothetical protein